RPTPLRISLNNRMVVESIRSTSLNVNPKVRLSDKKDSYCFTNEKYNSSKNLLGRLRKPSLAVLLAGALSSPKWFSLPLKALNPSHISVIESQRLKMPKSIVTSWVLVLNDL